ncbi:DNA polymerase III subunit delta' [Nonlabens sp. YIK11]|uniref:DNA polymerase III subunit n=1 Tax=Nonlabens sp. YIK11 TaxID=1453349 RepID=UPI0006DC263A|nr:DNA polymerase III subunit delta' [Nonlabens sp. YIK11]KQC32376.1 DNA polymerase III subunit delta' [Nonlabens sp. YIK11]
MQEHDIIGLEHLKKHLQTTVANNRIAHAQLFVGPSGSGALPLAHYYANLILCKQGDQVCDKRVHDLSHPDLHFAYPVASTSKSSTKPVSDDFASEWRQFLQSNPYGAMEDWYQLADIEKKSCEIRVHEATDISRKLSLKSYEGGAKVCIIWGAEFLNTAASNKLLKLIEEPPGGTVLILLTENENLILNTIRSRCQVLHIPKLSTTAIAKALQNEKQISENQAYIAARQSNGSYGRALKLVENDSEDVLFEEWFVHWVRTAFSAKGKPSAITGLIEWAETIAAVNRETQKRFLNFALELFRQAMLLNYRAESAVYFETKTGFDLSKFAAFIDGHRLTEISESFETALMHIDRKANAKIVFTDLSIGMTKILHKKA